MKKEVRVTVEGIEEEGEYLPKRAVDFMAFWDKALAQIPNEFRESALIEIEALPSNDYAILRVTVSYSRPETGEEQARRETREKRFEKERLKEELEELERLKKKYDA